MSLPHTTTPLPKVPFYDWQQLYTLRDQVGYLHALLQQVGVASPVVAEKGLDHFGTEPMHLGPGYFQYKQSYREYGNVDIKVGWEELGQPYLLHQQQPQCGTRLAPYNKSLNVQCGGQRHVIRWCGAVVLVA